MARVNEFTSLGEIAEIMEVRDALRGKRISITGHLGRKREDIVKIIEMAGGTYEDKPRWGVTYLLTNADWNANSVNGVSAKFKKAQDMNIKILSEKEFYDILCKADADRQEVK